MRRLPVIAIQVQADIQLVLGLPLGIKPKRIKRRTTLWLRPTGRAA